MATVGVIGLKDCDVGEVGVSLLRFAYRTISKVYTHGGYLFATGYAH